MSRKLTRIEEQTGETFRNEKSSKLPKIGKKHLKDNTKRSINANPDQSELNLTTQTSENEESAGIELQKSTVDCLAVIKALKKPKIVVDGRL